MQCHIGPGADWFVRSKLSGVRQVFAVTFHTYDRPIPSPVQQLRPARETCEQCHWPQMFTGDKLIVRRKYADDEKNSELTTVLLLKIGGRTWLGGWEFMAVTSTPVREFNTSPQTASARSSPEVFYTDDSGKTDAFPRDPPIQSTSRRRAARHEQWTASIATTAPRTPSSFPNAAVDQALADGRISPDLPFVKKLRSKH